LKEERVPNAKTLMPSAISTIVVGEPKSGKTRAIGTWPGPVFVFSFDGGIASLAGKDVDYELYVDADRYKPTAYTRFVKDLDDMIAKLQSGEAKYKTIVLDNITFLSKHMMNSIQFTNRTVDKPAGYEGYRMLLNKMSDVIVKAKALGVHLVVTAESKIEKDEITGEIVLQASIEGSYREFIVAEFDLALYTKVGRDLKDARKPRYIWQTVPDHRIKCAGSRWDCGLEPEEEQDFQNVLRKIEIKFPHVKQQETV
jgi:hypothetical protein